MRAVKKMRARPRRLRGTAPECHPVHPGHAHVDEKEVGAKPGAAASASSPELQLHTLKPRSCRGRASRSRGCRLVVDMQDAVEGCLCHIAILHLRLREVEPEYGPPPGASSKPMAPPSRVTISRLIASPSPVPSRRGCRPTRPARRAGNAAAEALRDAGPLVADAGAHAASGRRSARPRRRSGRENFAALRIRFERTCESRSGSPMTRRSSTARA